ncbi:hypothetical protein SEUCBS139899_010682 [Sporothrix eucalyptigena]
MFAPWDGWHFDPSEDIRCIVWDWSYPVGDTVTELGQPDNHRRPEDAQMQPEFSQNTFEPRRQEIIRRFHESHHLKDEHTDYELEALQPILGLMQHEPENRISLQEALSCSGQTTGKMSGQRKT